MDETFDVLTHPYRRYVLYYLRTHSEVVAVDTLTAMLANELDGSAATAGSGTTDHIEISLRHMHLPKLTDAGLITVAQDGQSVELDEGTGHGQFIDQAARIDGYAPTIAGD
ncbi:DUF7344 domain-containing protein [Halobaculum rarum]|uniref:DUF7344 domain-containing protein n=1 Tax=Halobaculum rarum TaxID=3075122 RepID=UPI0032B011CF